MRLRGRSLVGWGRGPCRRFVYGPDFSALQPRGVVVKLGLDRFLQEHADTASEQADSAYADLVRLTGHDPVTVGTLDKSHLHCQLV